jgi:heat shock protein HtpX
MKRGVLFLLTNIAVILVVSISARNLDIDRFLTNNGLNMGRRRHDGAV